MSLGNESMQSDEPDSSVPAPLERKDPVIVSETELIPQSSLDFELERVLNRLELLYRSLQDSRAIPESTAPPQVPFSGFESGRNLDRKRASVALFSSHVRTRERREFVVGLSFAVSSPLGFLQGGSGRNRLVLVGCMVTILAAFWLGAHHLSNTAEAQRFRQQEAGRIAPPPVAPPPREHIEPITKPREETASVPPAAGNHAAREQRKAGLPESPSNSSAQVDAVEYTAHDPESPVPREPVPRSLESLKAIQKLTSQAQSLLEPESVEPDPLSYPEPPETEPSSTSEQPPVPTLKVIPAYPEEARLNNVTGAVEMLVSVDAQGNVTHVEAVSGPPELREAAMDAMLRWRFKPATMNGVKTPGTGRYTVSFEPAKP
jgi:TonB family protein